MNDFQVTRQLRGLNKQGRAFYINDSSTYDFTTAGYLMYMVTSGYITGMTNSLLINSSVVTSADTWPAGSEIGGHITAVQIGPGAKAIMYCANAAFFIG
jgi:hypothetical protein